MCFSHLTIFCEKQDPFKATCFTRLNSKYHYIIILMIMRHLRCGHTCLQCHESPQCRIKVEWTTVKDERDPGLGRFSWCFFIVYYYFFMLVGSRPSGVVAHFRFVVYRGITLMLRYSETRTALRKHFCSFNQTDG